MAEFLYAKGSALTEIKLRACTQTAGLHPSAKAFACDGPHRMRRSEWSKGQRRMRQRPLRHIRGGLRGTAQRTAAPPAIEQSDSQPRGIAVQCRQQLGRCQRRSVMHGWACMVQRGLSVRWMRWCRISQRSAGGQFSTSFRFTNMGTHFTSNGHAFDEYEYDSGGHFDSSLCFCKSFFSSSYTPRAWYRVLHTKSPV